MTGAATRPFLSEPSNGFVGFLDAIKRWRLARKGMSSGKKRRTSAENPLVGSMDRSRWVRALLYAVFAATCTMLIYGAGLDTSFGRDPIKGALVAMVLALAALATFQSQHETVAQRNSRVVLVLGGLIAHLLLVQGVSRFVEANDMHGDYKFLLIPFAFAPMIHAVLLGRGVGILSTVFVTLLGSLLVPTEDVQIFLVVSMACGLVTVRACERLRKRVQLMRAGAYAGATAMVLSLLFDRIHVSSAFTQIGDVNLMQIGWSSLAAFGSAILTAMVVSALLPLFEVMFQLTTEISWLEASDLNHKLLRRLQLEAPGTFHHSLVVASLAEAAAESIGANATLCRVCSYFHDIGKLTKPEYFIENQGEGIDNPHDNLTPTMSSLVIIAHVKDGVDLAVKNKLNPRIIDVIKEHHGDSLVYYFYRKAQEQLKAVQEKVDKGLRNPEDLPQIDEKSFRYPGPKPRTRESGIISLADALESASRSLQKPSPAKIKSLVDDIVEARICSGQLDDCSLTMREIAKVKESFAGTLRSMMHNRIKYPREEERSVADVIEVRTEQGGKIRGNRTQKLRIENPPTSVSPRADG